MRHRRKGRTLGRKPNHQRALLRNLASSLFLSERDDEVNEAGIDYTDYPAFVKPNPPKVKGRIVTTIQKAKEVRPLVEKCITIARKSLKAERAAEEFATSAERGSSQWTEWRQGEQWQKWNQAIAPAVAARRRVVKLLGNKHAMSILFDEIAERYEDRDGGYTRVLRLAKPRLGDAGTQAVLELVGTHDRVKQRSEKPSFEDDLEQEDVTAKDEAAEPTDSDAAEEETAQDSSEEDSTDQPVDEKDE